jgi:hypothetical protein
VVLLGFGEICENVGVGGLYLWLGVEALPLLIRGVLLAGCIPISEM